MPAYYKKQVEIAREFGVSEATVINWIKGSLNHKNNLQLTKIGEDHYVLKNENNRVEMLNLAEKGRKFRKDESEVDLIVKEEFYEMIDEDLAISIANNLMVKLETPYKYSFLGEGSTLWNDFFEEQKKYLDYGLASQEYLWSKSIDYLNVVFEKYDQINIIDLGPGNFEPVDYWVNHLKKIKKFRYYLPIDISKHVLEISTKKFLKKHSLEDLFDYQEGSEDLFYQKNQVDFEKTSLETIVNRIKSFDSKIKSLNLFLLLGGTIGNSENQIRTLFNIKDSMSPDDYLIIDNAFDTVINRTIFPAETYKIYDQSILSTVRMLGITPIDFEKEFRYNEQTKMREYNLVLNRNVNIHFKKFNMVVELKKGDRINVWKHRRDDFEFISEKMTQAGLSLQFVAKHPTDPEIIYLAKAG